MRVFGTYGHVCWLRICQHPGASSVDHVEPVTEHPERAFSISNMRPAHGSRNRCPECGQCCNQLKGGMSVERARRIIAERMEKRPAPVPRQDGPRGEPGRDW